MHHASKLSLASGDANARAARLCVSGPKTDIAAPTRTNSTPLSPPLDLIVNTEFEVGFAMIGYIISAGFVRWQYAEGYLRRCGVREFYRGI